MQRRNEHLHFRLALVPRRLEQRGMVFGGEVSPEERDRRQRNRSLDEQIMTTGNRVAARAAAIRAYAACSDRCKTCVQ